MHDVIVAVPNDSNLAEFIGKKGSVNSITFYNRKADTNITALAPTNMEDKFYAMAQAMLMADLIVISTDNIDSNFGEALIAAALLQKYTLFSDENDVLQFISKSGLKEYRIAGRATLINEIVAFAGAMEKEDDAGHEAARVDIDKAFPVKGIGAVLLGIVRKGTIKKHDKFNLSSGRIVEIRSIQSHDVDVDEASRGTRVGLAVKGIDDKEVSKGDILSNIHILPTKDVTAKIEFSRMVKAQEDKFDALFVSGFSSANAQITRKNEFFSVVLEKDIALELNEDFLLIRKIKPRVFAAGKVIAFQGR